MIKSSSTKALSRPASQANLSHAILTMLKSNDAITESGGSGSRFGNVAIDTLLRFRDPVDAIDGGAGVAALPDPLLDMAVEDWDALYRAVEARLRRTVDGQPGAAPGAGAHVRSIVLECVAALEHLHTALANERARREQLELGVLDAQAALARALDKSAAR